LNKKTIYLVVAVLVVIIVVGVAAYALMNQGNGGTPSPTPTPAPSTPVSEAASLQFSVNETTTASGDLVVYQFACKDLNTANEKIRVDMDLGAAGAFSYIVDAGVQKSWVTMDNGATWTESDFAADWTAYGTLFHDFVDKLVADGDDAQDLSYTTDTTSIVIYCIAVDPTLEDSLFTAS
jgi:hypothetical protein